MFFKKDGQNPQPAALLINKTSPKMLKQTNLSHWWNGRQIKEKFEQESNKFWFVFLLDTIR